MKKVLLSVLVVAFAMPFITSCKKGAEDPGISFKSRDGRLKGVWKLTKFEGMKMKDASETTDGNASINTSNTSYTFDGTTMKEVKTEVDKSAGSTITKTVTTTSSTGLAVEVTFEDGKITSKSTNGGGSYIETTSYSSGGGGGTSSVTISGSGITTDEGNWYWIDSKKNKVGISTTIDGIASGVNFSGNLVKLASKEMILEDVYSSKGNNSYTYIYTGGSQAKSDNPVTSHSFKYTFEKQK